MQVVIRDSDESDLGAISDVVMAAFGPDEGPEIVELIANLLADESARPLLSLLATADGKTVAHVLFTKVGFKPSDVAFSGALLAPLAVHPDFQSMRIGARLVEDGLHQLSAAGVDLVFVLGHPDYYPRLGFKEAGLRGFAAPHPIPHENAAAWMVRDLHPLGIPDVPVQVVCADAIADPGYWRE